MMVVFMMFLTMLFWHALADYPLQGALSSMKRRDSTSSVPWWIAMFWHSYIHACGVMVITGNVWAGLAELVAHATIDHLKANCNKFGHTTDQLLHVLTKVLIIAVLRVRFV